MLNNNNNHNNNNQVICTNVNRVVEKSPAVFTQNVMLLLNN